MAESVRHEGTEPPSPYQPMPSQEEPLGEWNRWPDDATEPDAEPARKPARGDHTPDSSVAPDLPDRPLPPQD